MDSPTPSSTSVPAYVVLGIVGVLVAGIFVFGVILVFQSANKVQTTVHADKLNSGFGTEAKVIVATTTSGIAIAEPMTNAAVTQTQTSASVPSVTTATPTNRSAGVTTSAAMPVSLPKPMASATTTPAAAPTAVSSTYTNKTYGYSITFPAGWKRSMPESLATDWHAYVSSTDIGQAEMAVRAVRADAQSCNSLDMCMAYYVANFGLAGFTPQDISSGSSAGLVYVDGVEARILDVTLAPYDHDISRHLLTLFVLRGSTLYVITGDTNYVGEAQIPLMRTSMLGLSFNH